MGGGGGRETAGDDAQNSRRTCQDDVGYVRLNHADLADWMGIYGWVQQGRHEGHVLVGLADRWRDDEVARESKRDLED